MRLNYRGNYLFALPIGNLSQIFRKGETHQVDQEAWDKLKSRKDIDALIKQKILIEMADREVPAQKGSSVSAPIKTAKVEEAPQTPTKSMNGLVNDVLNMHYKKAIDFVEACDDNVLLERLLKADQRPSVQKAIKKRIE